LGKKKFGNPNDQDRGTAIKNSRRLEFGWEDSLRDPGRSGERGEEEGNPEAAKECLENRSKQEAIVSLKIKTSKREKGRRLNVLTDISEGSQRV